MNAGGVLVLCTFLMLCAAGVVAWTSGCHAPPAAVDGAELIHTMDVLDGCRARGRATNSYTAYEACVQEGGLGD